MSEHLKPIGDSLGSLFADLERRAQATVDLAARVRSALTGPEKDHVLSASYQDQTLVIVVDSAAWSSHIRYAQDELLARLRAAGETQFTKIRVRVGQAPAPAGQGG